MVSSIENMIGAGYKDSIDAVRKFGLALILTLISL